MDANMENEVRINIQIADTKHPLLIDRDEEPVVRKAARLVNESVAAYAAKYRSAGLPQSYFVAFAALDIAVKYLKQDADSNALAAEADLEALAGQIREYLKN